MNFLTLDDDERVIVETAAAFAAKRLAPHALEWDRSKHFPIDALRDAAELGMATIYCSEDVGGSGLRRLDGVRIFEQLAIADPVVAAFISIHNMCSWMIDTYGTADQRKTWIPRLASMEAIASYCLTEPGAGSDAAAFRTKAVRDWRALRDRRRQAVHLRGGQLRRVRGDGPHRRRRPARHLGVHHRKGHSGAEFRRERGEDGLARPAHRPGHPGRCAGARRRDARRPRRRRQRFRYRDERSQRWPAQHRGVLAGWRAVRLRPGGHVIWPIGRPSAGHCSTSPPSGSPWPTWPPRWRARD